MRFEIHCFLFDPKNFLFVFRFRSISFFSASDSASSFVSIFSPHFIQTISSLNLSLLSQPLSCLLTHSLSLSLSLMLYQTVLELSFSIYISFFLPLSIFLYFFLSFSLSLSCYLFSLSVSISLFLTLSLYLSISGSHSNLLLFLYFFVLKLSRFLSLTHSLVSHPQSPLAISLLNLSLHSQNILSLFCFLDRILNLSFFSQTVSTRYDK